MWYKFKTLWMPIAVIAVLAVMLAACGGGGGGAAQPTASGGGGAAQPTASGGGAAQPTASGGGAAQPTASGGGGGATAGACPASAANQAITMWSPLTGPDGKFMTDLANRFSSENGQGIKVTHLPQPEMYPKLQAATAAKNLPEMTVIHLENIPEYAIRGTLKPISGDALTAIGDVKGDFPAEVWAHGEFKGQRYSVPLDVHPLVLYYNKQMFQAAGVAEPPTDKPWSKADFEKAVDALNKNGVSGISIGTAFQGATLFQSFIRQLGGAMASEDGTKATFNSDAGVQALTYIADLKKKYSPGPSGAGDPEAKVFQQGKAAMTIHGPWHITDMEKLGFVGYAPIPQIGSKYGVWAGSHNLAITTDNAAKQAAAACWIAWLSKNSVEWAKAGQLPVRTSVRTSAGLKTAAPPISAIGIEADAVTVWPLVPGIVDALWGQSSGEAIDAVLLGQKTDVKKALDDAAAKADKILADNANKYK